MNFLIVSGLSGAGKSKAVTYLEDIGYYCVDNLPASLIPKFAELYKAGAGKFNRVAVVVDIRGGQTFDGLFQALDQMQLMGCEYKILFMDASTETIIKRYKETRRTHPLQGEGMSLEEAVEQERSIMQAVRERAEYIIDTTVLSTAKLRGEILNRFGTENTNRTMGISIVSFGFKYGIPVEADLLFDVRFLPNPFYVPELRGLTGLDKEVEEFVFGYKETEEFVNKIEDLIDFLLPHYVEEGKTALVIAIGCTGGRHRSVAVTHALAEFIRQKGYRTAEQHRDMMRA